MKRFSDNKKGSKGFYTALGISAVMIGSACYFAYDQGEKLTEEFTAKNSVSEPDEAVDRHVDDVPKVTMATYSYRTEAPTTATTKVIATAPPIVTTPPVVTVPSAEIIDEQDGEPVNAEPEQEQEIQPAGVTKMENVKAPLADMGDIIGVFSGGELVKSITTGSWQTHNGVDISAEVGDEVYAISGGEIMEIENDAVWGVTVLLDHHNGFMTKYCGLSNGLEVQRGDIMVSGDLIGTVGNTADIESALAPHLHIEVTHNGNYIDPLSAIN
ncbi:MAG: M23 family metallopeptidase [Ruminococcus flavefaciens]|nr:M23 family metallopeptidase [Ruminococcus flavefaciens]MCM1229030.1 M23 family metallopeptidase [Ruminococcus flavefaciens]